MNCELRIGNGFDIHRFAPERKLVLGGVEIPYNRGLEGHSDADVLLHAIKDSILGALGWGDIGTWFPNNDPKYKDANSLHLLAEVWSRASLLGWKLNNLDCVVLAEQPKLQCYIPKMAECIATTLGATTSQVSIKATTLETLGALGRGEGIAATAVVLLTR